MRIYGTLISDQLSLKQNGHPLPVRNATKDRKRPREPFIEESISTITPRCSKRSPTDLPKQIPIASKQKIFWRSYGVPWWVLKVIHYTRSKITIMPNYPTSVVVIHFLYILSSVCMQIRSATMTSCCPTDWIPKMCTFFHYLNFTLYTPCIP